MNSDPTGEGPRDSNYDDEPLVSGPIVPITMSIELLIPGMQKKVALKALLDVGCTRCLISPTLVGNLGIHYTLINPQTVLSKLFQGLSCQNQNFTQ